MPTISAVSQQGRLRLKFEKPRRIGRTRLTLAETDELSPSSKAKSDQIVTGRSPDKQLTLNRMSLYIVDRADAA
jgi:hypothetical protein